jgi:23S rRNA U2552 (ribose-2'-O)-methylase RlmE/FtsJ
VVAVDLHEIKQKFPSQVLVLRADAFLIESKPQAEPGASAPEESLTDSVARYAPYDVVLSDMAPNTSGSKVSDQARSFDLFMKALDVASAYGKAGSNFVGKIFMSDDFPKARAGVAERYAKVRVIRPEGTRTGSSEIFVVGMGRR